MPELPEVETVCRGLAPYITGVKIQNVQMRRPDLRVPFPNDFMGRLAGAQVVAVERRAKYILWHLDHGETLIIHLGMSGRIQIDPNGHHTIGKHDHVSFYFTEAASGLAVHYIDPRRFGLMAMCERTKITEHRLFAGLGPEPFGDQWSPAYLYAALQKKQSSIKAALLNQKIVSGVGNIYACEVLYRAGIDPWVMAGSIDFKGCECLVQQVREVLSEAIKSGGSSLRDYAQPSGALGYFQHKFMVYNREGVPCVKATCDGVIERKVQANRSTFYCPVCQPKRHKTP